MRLVTVIVVGALCAGCASEPSVEGSALSDGSTVFTLRCDEDWAQCYAAAQKACGKSGYEEVDRAIDGSLSSAGRLQHRVFTEGGRENSVYDEGVHEDVTARVITVRCKSP